MTPASRLIAALAAASAAAVAAPALADGHEEARQIAANFQRLGMETERAQCFAVTISQNLPAGERPAAVDILETAEDKDDVKLGVIQAGGSMVGAFTMADASCRG